MRGKKAVLVVSFGTSYKESMRLSLEAIEKAIAEALEDFEVRHAFTSKKILHLLEKRERLVMAHVEDALKKAEEEGMEVLIVQPTHLTEGNDFVRLKNLLNDYKNKFGKLLLASPLLTKDEDLVAVAEAVVEGSQPWLNEETGICLVGHGVDAQTNEVYLELQETFGKMGYDDYYVGTIKGAPSSEEVLMKMKAAKRYKRVVLLPLMIVAGAHAVTEMAGDEDGTWKDAFLKAGYNVECVLKGLGEYEKIQQIFVEHTNAVVKEIAEE